MVKMMVDVPDKINSKLIYYRLDKQLKTKQQAAIAILTKFFESKNAKEKYG